MSMKLHWSPRSPFVLKVMVVLREYGLLDSVELVRSVVPTTDPAHAIFRDSPLGQIPALVSQDGCFFDSYVICEYLDTLRAPKTVSLFPQGQIARLDMLRRHALGQGLMEALVAWTAELARPPELQMPQRIARHKTKLDSVLRTLDAQVSVWPEQTDLGHVAIVCALKYIDFRFASIANVTENHGRLQEWHEKMRLKKSIAQSSFSED